MALTNCPECNNNVSDKAEVCPHCGIKLHHHNKFVNSTNDVKEKGELIISTKSLYDSAYWKDTLPGIIGIMVISVIMMILLSLIVGVLVAIIGSSIYGATVTSKNMRFKMSYIEAYENVVSGVSCIKNNEGFAGTNFLINYANITHLDTVNNHEIIIHTTHGIYKAQAFNCAEKVKSIIINKIENA